MSTAVTKEAVVTFIENMSVLELSQLVKELEQKFGVSAAAPVAVAAAGAGATAGATDAAKTEFTVVLAVAGDKKINVIKEVRAITGLGLKEAVSKAEAEEIKKKLEAEGAKIEIK